jgi:hypothetical protein
MAAADSRVVLRAAGECVVAGVAVWYSPNAPGFIHHVSSNCRVLRTAKQNRSTLMPNNDENVNYDDWCAMCAVGAGNLGRLLDSYLCMPYCRVSSSCSGLSL